MLARLQQRWLDQLLTDVSVPVETQATCSDCPMCKVELRGDQAFSARSKCCTHIPKLANFLVGAVIDEQPELIDVHATQLRTPLGVIPHPSLQPRYEAMIAAGTFGRELSLRCPYHLDGSGDCGIWRSREAECSTWFCASSHGPAGFAFWQALRELLRFIEAELSSWCVRERGLEPARAAEGDPRAWAQWWGREGAFYRECAASVDALDRAALLQFLPDPLCAALCGAVVHARAQLDAGLVWPRGPSLGR